MLNKITILSNRGSLKIDGNRQVFACLILITILLEITAPKAQRDMVKYIHKVYANLILS